MSSSCVILCHVPASVARALCSSPGGAGGRAEGSEGVRLDPFPLARVRAGFAEITPLFLGFINRGP